MITAESVNLASAAAVVILLSPILITMWPLQREFMELRRRALAGEPPTNAAIAEWEHRYRKRILSVMLPITAVEISVSALFVRSLLVAVVGAFALPAVAFSAWFASRMVAGQLRDLR